MNSTQVDAIQFFPEPKPLSSSSGANIYPSHLPNNGATSPSSPRQATSPTTGQTHPHSAGSRGQDQKNGDTGGGTKKESKMSAVKSDEDHSMSVPPMNLYPLSNFLSELLTQENFLWGRNENILKSLKCESANDGSTVSEPDPPNDNKSHTTIMTSSTSGSSAGGRATHDGGKATHDGGTEENNKEPLYFIRYGQLTDLIHAYFRKLEKRHSCLHLTGRRAKHETLRHVDVNINGGQPEDPPSVPRVTMASIPQAAAKTMNLRDEDLLVYRCALMCSQFPMLSAPNPPDGQSPTPPPPSLPSIFHTTTLEYSQTAPSEEAPGLLLNGSECTSYSLRSGLENGDHYYTDTSKGAGPLSTVTTSPDTQSVDSIDGVRSKVKKKSAMGGTRVATSDPITIKSGKTRTKSKSIKRHFGIMDVTDSSSLAKLPPGDSDEEAELVKLISRKETTSEGDSSPAGREHPFSPMVNREMLYSLVRHAFQQTEEQQVNFEASLKHEYGRRSKGEILAKELAGQLQVLENNAHPFYKPKLFVTRNGYDLWLQGEKERVRKLIDKFWHCSLPRPQLWRNFDPTDYHRAYAILLRKIIDSESRTERKEPVHSGKTPSSPLSPTARRLLTEFGLRYGVGELYRRIVYLEYLAKHFDYEIWYIKHCTEELRSIRNLLPRIRNKITAIRPEMEILRSTIHLLHGQADNSLTRIDRLFLDDDPRKGVASLIELLAEVLDAEQNLFGKRVHPVEDWLKRYLKSGFILRYERRKEIASDETIGTQTVQPFVLTPTLVNSLLLDTRDEVYEFRDKFQSVFRPYFDVVPFSKVEFYRLLCADACSLCARTIHRETTRKSLSLEMLGLMYRLNERDIEWQSVVDPEHQLWRHQFQTLACSWMDVLGKQIDKWTIDAVENDQWTLLAFDTSSSRDSSPSSSFSSTSTERVHSTKNPHILSSIRISPFPTPPAPGRGEGPLIIGGSRVGAFTPYRLPTKRHEKLSPVLSESSGAITDSTPGSCRSPLLTTSSMASIAGEMPLIFQGSSKKKVSPESSILTFATKREASGIVADEDDGIGPAHVMEVSVSVYSDSDSEQDGLAEDFLPVMSNGLNSNTGSNLTLTVEHAQFSDSLLMENGTTGQVVSAPPMPSAGSHGNRETTPSCVTSSDADTSSHCTKFNNLLDKCRADDSDVVRPKPRVAQDAVLVRPEPRMAQDTAIVRPEPRMAQDDDTVVRSKLSTIGRGSWNEDQSHHQIHGGSTYTHQTSHNDDDLHKSEQTISSSEVSPSPLQEEVYRDEPKVIQSFLFPVSNSPMDIVTMLSRLASFTGELLNVLTPKIRKSSFNHADKLIPQNDEYSPEVSKARQQALERQKNARTMKSVFLKKLNRTMISSLRLYADNLLCMDLCGWSTTEATNLLGDQKLHHLNRRKEVGEIWGCRHMVEANHGLHPNGIPCHKKSKDKFEHITPDMCIRINDMHLLITIFHSLEDHLYSKIRTDSKRPISAFGYVSSDHSERSPNMSLLHSKTNKPNPARSGHQKTTSLFQRDVQSWPSSISTGLGPMETDERRQNRARGDSKASEEAPDSPPNQSRECLEYLKEVQCLQVKMVAIRMNKLCKCALSELLGLKLRDCSIEKRLVPVVDYLNRHRVALEKYVYPDCFNATMEFVWEYILQDLEDEALKLRSSKRPVTDRAQMLLQALAHMIQFMHNRNEGLNIDMLTSSSEYLQGFLDIMTRSTDQLINIFNKLSTSQFLHNVLDLSQAPVVLDSKVLKQLRSHLRSVKKCFTGKEFIKKVTEIGRGVLVESIDDLERERSSSVHVLQSPTGQPIEYSDEYANTVAQYLLDNGILIQVPQTRSISNGSSILITPEQNTDGEDCNGETIDMAPGSHMTDPTRPLRADSIASSVSMTFTEESPNRSDTANSRRAPNSASRDHYSVTSSTRDSPGQIYRCMQRNSGHHHHHHHQENSNKAPFLASSHAFYKFAGSEDTEFALLQSQILVSSTAASGRSRYSSSLSTRVTQEENQDFDAARKGTLDLIYDLLSQRAHKEKVAKHFMNSSKVQGQRRRVKSAKSGLIFRM